MDILINVVLPLSLAIIMLSLGIGLTLDDFARVARQRRGFLAGAVCQMLLLPLVGFTVATVFGLSPELAVGVMLLALCPGGVTSNILTRLARGDVALSVSLTAVISLVSVVTMPVLAAWSVAHFMGAAAPQVSVTSLGIAMFVITALPVCLGVAVRHKAPQFADRVEPVLTKLATALFILIVVAALGSNWALFVENIAVLGPVLITFNAALMLMGLAVAALCALDTAGRKTLSIETGVQNATLGITLAALISGQTDGFSTLAMPSAFYGVTMYLVAAPFVLWFRRG
ncbi:bile acid:sodium symporter family protein [Sulfitobacter sp. S190]|uniref:bile acid:sodium symporter family protein n=1 Tax=Sulfitobacter sp. S190 TaxID=2867022 RepID=UPI0021A2AB63|nr:bile acid:sodium symporter family protein [Sulfitobacter sp. S190]UWR21536.1 bile acid:sodium symporter family protein [Sulfitobacter sp. S190]